MQYAKFNEIRNSLNELEEIKKPLTKFIAKLVCGLSIKYQNTFEFHLINDEPSDEVKELSADLIRMTPLEIDTEIEVTLFKLAKMLEVKESNLKYELSKLI